MRALRALRLAPPLAVVFAAALVTACGGNGSSGAAVDAGGARGSLIQNPPLRSASLTASDLTAQLNANAAGQQLLLVAGTPTCGIDVHYLQYGTVDGENKATTATGALMIPTGAAANCTGPRPILLYAHGTTLEKRFNLAAIADSTNPGAGEAGLIAAFFAAQGYIVVAPNYAGYDASPLTYHPYLNGDQQSKDMIDALSAAKKAIGHVFASGTTDSGKLFVTGYSQGGYVAMATVRAMQAATPPVTVTASAPMSGPYALEAFGDAVIFGSVNLGSTVFMPLITNSYQRSYGGIYPNGTSSAFYAQPYANGIDTLLPSTVDTATLLAQNKLPQTALFDINTPQTGSGALDAALAVPANPLFALGFGATPLIQNSVRVAYGLDAIASPDGAVPSPQPGVPTAATPQYPLRAALKLNDLRTAWAPARPMLLCGGNADPSVFFPVNTQTMQAFWAGLPNGLVTVLDVDSPVSVGDQFTAVKQGFAAAKALVGAGGPNAVVQAYHASLVPPFCAAAVRGFFGNF